MTKNKYTYILILFTNEARIIMDVRVSSPFDKVIRTLY